MPEENWAAHGGVQACDLCHARKVCDTATFLSPSKQYYAKTVLCAIS